QCSASAVHLTRNSSPIPQKFFPGRGCAVKSQESIDLIPWSSRELQNVFEMAPPPSAIGAEKGITAAWDDLRIIVGVKHFRSAGPGDRVAGQEPYAVLEPG